MIKNQSKTDLGEDGDVVLAVGELEEEVDGGEGLVPEEEVKVPPQDQYPALPEGLVGQLELAAPVRERLGGHKTPKVTHFE